MLLLSRMIAEISHDIHKDQRCGRSGDGEAKKPANQSKEKPIEHYVHKDKQRAPNDFMFQLTSEKLAALEMRIPVANVLGLQLYLLEHRFRRIAPRR